MKVRREAPPPSPWIKSQTGTYARLRKVGHRDSRGAKLYRLGFFCANGAELVWSSQTWRLEQLLAAGVRFLARRPSAKAVTL